MIKNKKEMLNFLNLHKDLQIISNLSIGIKNYIYNQQNASMKIIQFIEKKL